MHLIFCEVFFVVVVYINAHHYHHYNRLEAIKSHWLFCFFAYQQKKFIQSLINVFEWRQQHDLA